MKKLTNYPFIQQLKRLRQEPLLLIVILLILGSLLLFIIYPLYRVISVSFIAGGNVSLAVFQEVFASAYLRRALVNSLGLGGAVACLGVAIGFLFAFSLTHADLPFKRFFHLVAIIPIISPPFIGALSIFMLPGNNGLISWHLLGLKDINIYGFHGLLLAQVVTFFPVAYIMLKGTLASINPTLEDAALDLGSSRWQVFRTITLPLALPGITGALLILFVETLADFGNPMVLAGSKFPVLSVQAYLQITGMYNLPKGAALALVLLVPSVTVFLLQKYWLAGKKYITITGKSAWSVSRIVAPAAYRHTAYPAAEFHLPVYSCWYPVRDHPALNDTGFFRRLSLHLRADYDSS